MEPSEDIVSTKKRAVCPARSIALRIAGMSEVMPVAVSLWTTHTDLMVWSLSSTNACSISSGLAPSLQLPWSSWASRLSFPASLCHVPAKCPVSYISTRSPGESVLTSAASHAPVPEEGYMITGCFVWKISLIPSSTSSPRPLNSGPRWSIVGRSMARRIRSGTLVGPGICKKWRPLWSRCIMSFWLMLWKVCWRFLNQTRNSISYSGVRGN